MAASSLGANRYAALLSDDEGEEGAEAEQVENSAKPKKKRVLKKAQKRTASDPGAAEVTEAAAAPQGVKKKRKRESSDPTGEKAANKKPSATSEKEEGPLPLGAERTLQGGVTVKVVRAAAEGATVAKKGCEVKLLYEGRLPGKNGRPFDVGEIDFLLGDNTMLQGFSIGVMGMAVGERRMIRIPWRLGYGRRGKKPKIPPKSDLEFDATLNFCGVDHRGKHFVSRSDMTNRRREAAKRRGKKPRAT
eukprot:TRINITY_DN81120_c0_g1_i1.p1 TRINITY_DN81120_c0_g1~~TRINITY_DN81120_c0_g1_i1.p1  ORF type:complete len:261 (-),score=67.04 TRINITY_DN81120_c0_g1_i1:130-870(-)